MHSGGVAEKNWTLAVDQCRLQALQFSVHLDLLSVFLRCDGFTAIQKALVDQMGSRPPNSDHDPFSDAGLALGSPLELLLSPPRSQGNWRWEGPLGTPLGLVHWKRASSPVEAGTAGYL